MSRIKTIMLKITLTIFFCLAVFVSNNFAQACGRGYYRIELNTKDSINFKLFPVILKGAEYWKEDVQTLLAEIFFPNEKKDGWFWNSAPKIENAVAEQFLANYQTEKYDMIYGELQSSGISKDGEIHLETSETYSMPFLLKLSAENYQTAFYLGSFLGGCQSHKKIDLDKL